MWRSGKKNEFTGTITHPIMIITIKIITLNPAISKITSSSKSGLITMAAIDLWIIFDLKMDGYERLKVAITATSGIITMDNLNYQGFHLKSEVSG